MRARHRYRLRVGLKALFVFVTLVSLGATAARQWLLAQEVDFMYFEGNITLPSYSLVSYGDMVNVVSGEPNKMIVYRALLHEIDHRGSGPVPPQGKAFVLLGNDRQRRQLREAKARGLQLKIELSDPPLSRRQYELRRTRSSGQLMIVEVTKPDQLLRSLLAVPTE